MEKEQLLEQLGESYGYVNQLVTKRIDYLKLEVAEKSATAISGLITAIILAVLGLITLIFALITLGFVLADLVDSRPLAFGIVTVVLLIILLVVYLLRNALITNPAVSKVIAAFFKNDGKEV